MLLDELAEGVFRAVGQVLLEQLGIMHSSSHRI
jgi:hypothetical protein